MNYPILTIGFLFNVLILNYFCVLSDVSQQHKYSNGLSDFSESGDESVSMIREKRSDNQIHIHVHIHNENNGTDFKITTKEVDADSDDEKKKKNNREKKRKNRQKCTENDKRKRCRDRFNTTSTTPTKTTVGYGVVTNLNTMRPTSVSYPTVSTTIRHIGTVRQPLTTNSLPHLTPDYVTFTTVSNGLTSYRRSTPVSMVNTTRNSIEVNGFDKSIENKEINAKKVKSNDKNVVRDV